MQDHDLDFVQVSYSLADQQASADRLLLLTSDCGMAVLTIRSIRLSPETDSAQQV